MRSLRSAGSFATLTRAVRGGFAPRTPLQRHSLALMRSLRSAGSLAAARSRRQRGVRPPGSPTASLARADALAPFRWLVRYAHSRRQRRLRPSDSPTASLARADALAPFRWLARGRSLAPSEGGSPPGLPYSVTRSR